MPLVVPTVNSNSGDAKTQEWTNKLVGKKLSDEAATETVRFPIASHHTPRASCLLTAAFNLLDLLQEGPSGEVPGHRAWPDGDHGLPAGPAERPCPGGRDR